MNIKELAPKNVCYDELVTKAPTYKGTKREMYDLIKSGKLTVVTDKNGNITGGWMDGDSNPMLDAIARDNFMRAYGSNCMSYMLECLELIRDGKDLPEEKADPEDEDVCSETVVDTLDATPDTVTLPDGVDDVKTYLRKTYGRCLAKGTSKDLVIEGNTVSNIKWGRKLSASELAKY